MNTLRLVGSGGANRAMEAELKRIVRRALPGFRLTTPKRVDPQTLVFPFDPDLAWVAVHYLRTPSRVLWDLGEARSTRLEPLYTELVEWIQSEKRTWLFPEAKISVRAREIRDFPASASQIQGTVKNALIAGMAEQGVAVHLDPEDPDVLISVRGLNGPLVISVDLAGQSMHARGYRLDAGEAPLKETLAAQMLMLSRWNPRGEALLDPMAGSGTIAIEGALMAVGAPVFSFPRKPLAVRLPIFRERAGSRLEPLFPGANPAIIANEIHTPQRAVLEKNLQRAGVGDRILRLHGDFKDVTVRRLQREASQKAVQGSNPNWDRGLVLSNPPYGERASSRGATGELQKLYRELRKWCGSLGKGWRAGFLAANPTFEVEFGLRPVLKKPMSNGPIRGYFLLYEF